MADSKNHRSKAAGESLGFLALLGGILVLVNVLGVVFWGRLDCTEGRLFSLSEGSKKLARSLDDKMDVVVYFTKDLPPPFNAHERYVRDLLEEYAAASGGRIRIKVVHPDTDEEKEKAEADGALRVQHQVIQNDSVSVVEGYRSIVLKYLGDKRVITVGQDTSGLEYEITMKMKELVGDKKPIGVVTVGGTLTPSKGLSRLRSLLPVYEIKEVDLSAEVDPKLAALLVVAPQEPFTEEQLKRIDQYVMRGGSLGIFGGGLKVNLEGFMPQAEPTDTGLNTLLAAWGLRLRKGMVADETCQYVPMRTRIGMLPVPYPPIPILSFDERARKHPVLYRLKNATYPFTSSLETVDVPGSKAKVTVLARTTERSWLIAEGSIPLQPKPPQEWASTIPGGRFDGPHPVLAVVEGTLPSAFAASAVTSSEDGKDKGPLGPSKSEKPARIFVAGSGLLIHDQFLPDPSQGSPSQLGGGVALALNAIDWLAQDADLIAIRAKNVEPPALDVPRAVVQAEQEAISAAKEAEQAVAEGNREKVEQAAAKQKQAIEKRKKAMEDWEQRKAVYRWGNTLGIPLLLALFGLLRWQQRKKKRELMRRQDGGPPPRDAATNGSRKPDAERKAA